MNNRCHSQAYHNITAVELREFLFCFEYNMSNCRYFICLMVDFSVVRQVAVIKVTSGVQERTTKGTYPLFRAKCHLTRSIGVGNGPGNCEL